MSMFMNSQEMSKDFVDKNRSKMCWLFIWLISTKDVTPLSQSWKVSGSHGEICGHGKVLENQ